MKKGILIAMVAFTLQAVAQRPQNHNRPEMMQNSMSFINDLSVNQIADLETKRMTYFLDLSKSQKIKVYKINLDIAKTRKANRKAFHDRRGTGKPSPQELYDIMTKKLDKQIEIKEQFKKILSEKQFEKWSKMPRNHFDMERGFKPNFRCGK